MRPILLLLVAAALWAADAAPDPAVGKKIFESQCALCHGQNVGGGRGPSLNRPQLIQAADDEALRHVISNGIPPEMPGAWQLNEHEVASVAAYVRSLGAVPPERLPGDAARGVHIYAVQGCSSCHMIAGQGEGIGPELTAIGARRNGAYLRQTLLNPSQAPPQGFQYIAAVTSEGATIRGILANEDSFTIQLKDLQGKFHSFRKSGLRDLQRLKESPMPSYERSLDAAGLDDLVAYLASLRGKS